MSPANEFVRHVVVAPTCGNRECPNKSHEDWREASKARGHLTELLLTRVDALNARIRELIMPEAA